MGFFQRLFGQNAPAGTRDRVFSRREAKRKPSHQCHFESLEERRLLAADIHLGAVYFDPTVGDDSVANTIQVSFEGGAPGTELTHIVFNGDKLGDGQVTLGDVFFDTAPGGLGAFGSAPVKIVSAQGFTVTNIKVADGSPVLEFDLQGFTAGDKLIFTVDVDEMGFLSANSLAEGGEFEGSQLTGSFTNTHYHDAQGSATFYDDFDGNFTQADTATGTELNLPPDRFNPTGVDQSDHTAGAVLSLKQVAKPITIAGTVFEDQNLNNSQDSGEQGIAGVQLSLLRLDGDAYVSTGLTTTTDAQGHYKFDNPSILPGTYKVVETQPSGYFSVGAKAGTVDGTTDGHVDTPDIISQIALEGGQNSIHNDFAEAKPASLSGVVYHDHNNDGIMQAGDEGIGGVNVVVRPVSTIDGSTAPIQTTTNADGTWSVTGLAPGTYRVTEVQPAAYVDGLDAAGSAGGSAVNPGDEINGIVLAPAQAGINYKFGEYKLASISGQVHADLNGDCVYQPGEPLLAGVTMQLLNANGQVIATTQTDANGEYKFDNLKPGTYGVQELQPAGYFNDTQFVGSAGGVVTAQDRIEQITLTSDVHGEHYDYCESLPGSISGRVHADLNGDCIYQTGEPLLSGVTMQLLNANGQVIATTQTDVNGEYKFDNLEQGTYGVQELQPAGYFNDTQFIGTAGGIVTAQDRIEQIEIGSGVNALHYDYCESLPGSISGRVHADLNGDCVYQPGEPLLAGVTMQLLDSSGKVIATTKTDANGEYKFDNLRKGTYGVQELQPAGYFNDTQFVGTAGGVVTAQDRIEQIDIGSGVNAVHYDYCESLPGSISGRVHADLNGDCVYQPGEPLLAGVTMQLLDSSGNVIATTKTDANGEYKFDNLRKGTYGVQELQPAGYFNDTQFVGTAGGVVTAQDRIEQIVIGSGVNALHYDYCESPPADVSGYVFQDGPAVISPDGQPPANLALLRDGKRTSDDTPLKGVVLQLRDGVTGELIDGSTALSGTYGPGPISVVTDANGFYQFTGLRSGSYAVYEVQPANYVDWIDTPGTTGGVAVNTAAAIDPAQLAALAKDPQHDAILAIPLHGGQHSQENNFSEVVFRPSIIVPPPPPELPPPPQPPLAPLLPTRRPDAPPPPLPQKLPPHDEGGFEEIGWYTWHLSVVNGGQPRAVTAAEAASTAGIETTHLQPVTFSNVSFANVSLDGGQWTIMGADGQTRQFTFGTQNGIPVVGDFNGDGKAEVGIYANGQWYIDLNGNGVWEEGDLWAQLGTDRDRPVVGDWDGDGKADIGIFGPVWGGDPRAIQLEPGMPDPYNLPSGESKNLPPKPNRATLGKRELALNSKKTMRSDLIDHVFFYGNPKDVPVVGDWNGDGVRTIGIFRDGTWYQDLNGDGHFDEHDRVVQFGQAGDVPVVGDWDGSGKDRVGVYRHGTWMLDTNGNGVRDASDKVFEMGGADDMPVVGNWNGDGVDRPAIYHRGRAPRLTAKPAAGL